MFTPRYPSLGSPQSVCQTCTRCCLPVYCNVTNCVVFTLKWTPSFTHILKKKGTLWNTIWGSTSIITNEVQNNLDVSLSAARLKLMTLPTLISSGPDQNNHRRSPGRRGVVRADGQANIIFKQALLPGLTPSSKKWQLVCTNLRMFPMRDPIRPTGPMFDTLALEDCGGAGLCSWLCGLIGSESVPLCTAFGQ